MGRNAGRSLLKFRNADLRGLFKYFANASLTNPATLMFRLAASPRNTFNCAGSS